MSELETGPRPRRAVVLVLGVMLLLVAGLVAFLLTRADEPDRGDGPGGPGGPGPPLAEPPSDATPARFCDHYAEVLDADDGRSVHAWVDAMATVGTPADAPAAVRAGFEILLRAADRTDTRASLHDLIQQADSLGDGDRAKLGAFTEYATTTCATEIEAALRESLPSDPPS